VRGFVRGWVDWVYQCALSSTHEMPPYRALTDMLLTLLPTLHFVSRICRCVTKDSRTHPPLSALGDNRHDLCDIVHHLTSYAHTHTHTAIDCTELHYGPSESRINTRVVGIDAAGNTIVSTRW
jgi:hypothetical protein